MYFLYMGILYLCIINNSLLVLYSVSRRLVKLLLMYFHYNCRENTIHNISERYYWKGMSVTIRDYVRITKI